MIKISLRSALASFLFGVTGLVALMATGAPATAADSTSFNPLSVSVQAQPISGVPVGTVISWPVSNNPDGWSSGNWLECNGQGISSSAYPELYAVVGGSVPDLRGLFLRGVGGNAAGLGQTQQASSLPQHTHQTGRVQYTYGWTPGYGEVPLMQSGPAEYESSVETRPVNKSVRYLIRAKP